MQSPVPLPPPLEFMTQHKIHTKCIFYVLCGGGGDDGSDGDVSPITKSVDNPIEC